MKTEFHEIYHRLPKSDSPREQFKEIYREYREVRELCHGSETGGDETQADELRKKLEALKERLSIIVIGAYNKSSSLQEFERELKDMLAHSGGVPLEEVNKYIVGSYLYPLSLKKFDSHSPVESIWATLENLKICERFVDASASHVHGMLMSGSMAIAPFYGVKGKLPEEIVTLGRKQLDFNEFSDVDFLASFKDPEQMKSAIDAYVGAGLLNETERKRFSEFEKLLANDKADMFSVRSHYQGVEESMHFLFDQDVASISRMSERHRRNGIGYLRDFRPNIPRSLVGSGHDAEYALPDKEVKIPITIEEVRYPGGKEVAGYLTQIPTGGLAGEGEKRRYVVSTLSFFLLITPASLIDTDGFLSDRLRELRERVKKASEGGVPPVFFRQEKMMGGVLAKLKASLCP